MTRFYSKETGGFYDDCVYAVMPDDALEITDDIYNYVFDIQSAGGTITAGGDGYPIGVACPISAERRTILQQIVIIENTITARRRDEAILGIDNGWLSSTRKQIDELRAALPAS